jgi:hypothetical protein
MTTIRAVIHFLIEGLGYNTTIILVSFALAVCLFPIVEFLVFLATLWFESRGRRG